jgi:hypothetical protein
MVADASGSVRYFLLAEMYVRPLARRYVNDTARE